MAAHASRVRSTPCARSGYLYEKDGAVWFRTTDFGDDKDRVLVKGRRRATRTSRRDIAYHNDKLDARLRPPASTSWGADHHGYIKRIRVMLGHVLGHPGQPEVVIGQMVNLFRDGEAVRMSKRTGEMVTLRGAHRRGRRRRHALSDALALDRPAHRLRYRAGEEAGLLQSGLLRAVRACAHLLDCCARRRVRLDADFAKSRGSRRARRCAHPARCRPLAARRRRRARARAQDRRVPGSLHRQVVRATSRRSASRTTRRIWRRTFHQFYTQCHVLTDDDVLTAARLFAADAARRVLRNALGLLGVSAPERCSLGG